MVVLLSFIAPSLIVLGNQTERTDGERTEAHPIYAHFGQTSRAMMRKLVESGGSRPCGRLHRRGSSSRFRSKYEDMKVVVLVVSTNGRVKKATVEGLDNVLDCLLDASCFPDLASLFSKFQNWRNGDCVAKSGATCVNFTGMLRV